MIHMILHGCGGHMGKTVLALTQANPLVQVVAGVNAVFYAGDFPIYTNINDCKEQADVIVDFSTATAVPALLSYAAQKGVPVVVCTTGLSKDVLAQIEQTAETVAVFRSANMSVGVNLLSRLLAEAATVLDESHFDIEIIEKHHNQKIDAPSGTALLLGDAMNQALGNKMDYVYDRSTKREKRSDHEIGFHSLRGGTIVGEHTVVFAGKDETIAFTHTAQSKDVFAVGALRAAQFLAGKPAGLYDMSHMLDAK